MKRHYHRLKKIVFNPCFGDKQEELHGGFPMGKGTLQRTMGAAAGPTSSADTSSVEGVEMFPPSHYLSSLPWNCSACVQALGSS